MNKLKFLPFYIVSKLPFPVLYVISDVLFIVTYYFIRYRRAVVDDNLKNAFPEKSSSEINQIRIDFYKNFCDLFLEVNKSMGMNKKSIAKRYKILNPELVENYYNENRSITLYSGHMDNWEWFCFLPINIPHRCIAFYQKQSSSYFNELSMIVRSNYGVECVESTGGFRALSKLNQEGNPFMSFIIGDQSPAKVTANTHWTTFLNRETAFLSGSERIAKRLNHVLLYPRVRKPKRGHYEIEFEVICEDSDKLENGDLINAYASLLEANIKSSPSLWLWSHNRWKLSKSKKSEVQTFKTKQKVEV